jgi:FkbM family methyltransferase
MRGAENARLTEGTEVLRSLVEKATRQTAFRRALPRGFGASKIYVSGSAGLKYLFRSMQSMDPDLCNLAREFVRPGSVVWDVGANVGLFAFSAAHLAGSQGSVVAIEADIWLVRLLRHSALIQSGCSAPVQVIPAAVAQACDLRCFNIASRSRAASSLAGYGSSQAGSTAETQTVLSVSLDWLAERLPSPDVLKIDVEGAELEVLIGARGLLARRQTVILCEVAAERAREVSTLLQANGYRIFDGEKPIEGRRELELAPWSTVAIPAAG